MLLKSAPISVWPGAAVIIARVQSPITESGCGYKLFTCCVAAGRNCGNRRFDIVDSRTFQVLRLVSFTSPSAGSGAVVAKGPADAIIVSSTGKQGVDFLCGRLSATQPQLQHDARMAADRRAITFLD